MPWYNTSWGYRKAITIDNTGGPAVTDYQVKIDLASPSFDFSKCNWDGSDIRVTAADGETIIPHLTQKWGGLAFKETLSPPSDPTYTWGACTGAAIGVLSSGGTTNDYLLGWVQGYACGSLRKGKLYCFDSAGGTNWSFQSPAYRQQVGHRIADVDNDGENEVITSGSFFSDQSVFLLDKDGNQIWEWNDPNLGINDNNYFVKGCAVGKFTADPDLLIATGNSQGWLTVLDRTGAIVDAYDFGATIVQTIEAADIDHDGIDEMIVAIGNHSSTTSIRCCKLIEGVISTIWSYTVANCYNVYALWVDTGLISSNESAYGIVFGGQGADATTYSYSYVGLLDDNGQEVWIDQIKGPGHATNGHGPGQCAAMDVNGDGVKEIVMNLGWGRQGTNECYAYGVGCFLVYDRDGNRLFSDKASGVGAYEWCVGDYDNDAEDEMLCPLLSNEVAIIGQNAYQTTDAEVWVKVDLPADSTLILYMYYGNPDATTISSGSNVFHYFDDGSSNASWTANRTPPLRKWYTTPIGYGGINTTGILATPQAAVSIDCGYSLAAPLDFDWIWEFFVFHDADDTGVRLRFAITDTGRTVLDSSIGLDTTTSTTKWCYDCPDQDADPGAMCTAASSVDRQKDWQRVKFVVTSTGVKAYIDGTEVLDSSDINRTTAQRIEIYAQKNTLIEGACGAIVS